MDGLEILIIIVFIIYLLSWISTCISSTFSSSKIKEQTSNNVSTGIGSQISFNCCSLLIILCVGYLMYNHFKDK